MSDPNLFRSYLRVNIPVTNTLFDYGERSVSLLHAQMRMGCSPLASDLFNLHVKEDARCSCGHLNENVHHYFFECPLFTVQRNTLLNQLQSDEIECQVNLLLYGSHEIANRKNYRLFTYVHQYIVSTKRFTT